MDKGVAYKYFNRLLASQPRLEPNSLDIRELENTYLAARGSFVPQFKLAASVFNRSYRHVTTRTNSVAEHHVQKRWAPLTTHVHAEIACLISSTRDQLTNGTIYIERYKLNGKYSCSFPCQGCMNAILSTKLRYLVCRDEHEQPTKLDLRTVV